MHVVDLYMLKRKRILNRHTNLLKKTLSQTDIWKAIGNGDVNGHFATGTLLQLEETIQTTIVKN